jgi:hypothetical protein
MQGISPPVISYLKSQTSSGFPCFRGTRVSGQLIVPDSVLNRDFLSRVASGRLSLRCRPGGHLKFLAFGLNTVSASVVGVDSDLTLTLQVSAFARMLLWSYKKFVNISYVKIEGTRVHVAIGSIPEVAAWRHVWKDRLSYQISTGLGSLIIQFIWEIA